MKQIVKIHDVITDGRCNVYHSDTTDDIEMMKNLLRPEWINLAIGGQTYVVALADLQKAVDGISK